MIIFTRGYTFFKYLKKGGIYDNEDELYELVKGCIQDIPMVRDYSIGDWIQKFDWKKMAPLYDKVFNSYI